jgi:hypothetical protein
MKSKWKPEVVHVDGDEFPWKAYAVKGAKRELIASFCETMWPHSLFYSCGFTASQEKLAIDAFYKGSKLKRVPHSGQKEALQEACSYCAMANNH